MKKLMMIALSSLLIAGAVQADFGPILPRVRVVSASAHGNFMPPIPPGFQGWMEYELEVKMCRGVNGDDYNVNVNRKGTSTYEVSFSLKSLHDCRALPRLQKVKVMAKGVPAHGTTYVLNPLLVDDHTTH